MNEAVDRLISERQRLDAGLPGTLLLSLVAHLLLIGVAVLLPVLLPKPPLLRMVDGFAVVLPRGGGGSPTAAAAEPTSRPAPVESVAPPPAPRVLKPSRDEERPNALPELEAKRSARKAEPRIVGRPASSTSKATATGASATPGLEFGPPGPGVPDGADTGDWYLAGVQQKIWLLWNQQLKAGFSQPIAVTFTILRDGNVAKVEVTQPSGATLLDMAAERAIRNASPFGPLPKEYGDNARTIQALFRPTS